MAYCLTSNIYEHSWCVVTSTHHITDWKQTLLADRELG